MTLEVEYFAQLLQGAERFLYMAMYGNESIQRITNP